jgi:ribosomal protein S18 acetylase RimI-like enzyme
VTTIEPLEAADLERAVLTMERAFMSDAMFIHLFPDPGRRSLALRAMNRVPIRYGMRFGHATKAHGARAMAVWVPPGVEITLLAMIRSGMLAMPFQLGLRKFIEFGAANEVMAKIHKQLVPGPHWYLLIVAVDPELQGKGAGSALVKEGLDHADAAGVPCYLETSEESNIGFYQRLGFSVVATATLGQGGPPAWAMRRDARPA